MAKLSTLVRRDLTTDPEITGVTADSRRVRPGYLFAALPGSSNDGRRFVPAALDAGAAAILSGEDLPGLSAPVVRAADPRRAYALAAAALTGRQPKVVVAVTGTNGKTSVAAFCRQIFTALGHSSASMGTLGVMAGGDQLTPPGLTTPDAADVAHLLADLSERGVTHLALEASSHGIDQRRLDGVRLTAAGFLNLTQDHLDYHGDMEAYRAAKLRLFHSLLPRGATAVLNADSDAFPVFAAAARTSGHCLMTVGAMGQGLTMVSRRPDPAGQRLRIDAWGRPFEVLLPLAGAFQAANALAAAGLVIAAGESPEAALAALEGLKGAPGRLQKIGEGPKGGTAYVDYAHTPDGLRTVLSALRPHASGRLIVVFGAGGDRDRGKRPQMGAIAADLADIAIVTDDNPRSEPPAAIRAEILAGARGLEEVGDRAGAIAAAVARLGQGDILVVAGKGHEQGQDVGGVIHPFDDAAVTAKALRGAA
ncbi:MAG TPA: UDP-N-acetylmuramoyl-L-alanyl-D-glutamate--2,6-diaminopimelate ligase [Caulobacteraceae bacterium]|jgi:UDP-N-acetylmuramoyl-L-alanyl-D-glutamate--2,6-diaminopimelate ligase